MTTESQQANIESQKSTLRKEIRELIDECLEVTDRNLMLKENIAELVYFFLGGEYYEQALQQYPYAAAKALSAFASKSEQRDAMLDFMGEEEYDWLCKMLYQMVEFCTVIYQWKANMIRLANIDWKGGLVSSQLSIEKLKIVKMRFEFELEIAKEKAKFGTL